MKKLTNYVPVVSFVTFSVLSAINPDYYLCLLFSGLAFCYQQWLFKQESPDYSKQIEELVSSHESNLEQIRQTQIEQFNKFQRDISEMKDTVGGLSLGMSKVAPQIVSQKQKIQF